MLIIKDYDEGPLKSMRLMKSLFARGSHAFGYIKINYAKKRTPVTEMKKFFFKGTLKKIKITVIKSIK